MTTTTDRTPLRSPPIISAAAFAALDLVQRRRHLGSLTDAEYLAQAKVVATAHGYVVWELLTAWIITD